LGMTLVVCVSADPATFVLLNRVAHRGWRA
jgi:hypothetical protein